MKPGSVAEQTSSSQTSALMSFAVRILIFIFPVALVLASYVFVLWYSGESWPLDRVVAAQRDNQEALFLRGLLDQSFYAYKYRGLLARQPEIIALGSSRVMKFRSEMFGAEGAKFFNAGGMIQCIQDLDSFSKLDPAQIHPKVILLGLDLWWFNDSFVVKEGLSEGIKMDGTATWQEHLLGFRNLLLHHSSLIFLELKNILAGKKVSEFIGLQARAKQHGFRPDGSEKGGLTVPSTEEGWKFVDREDPPVVERIRAGTVRFESTEGLSPSKIQILREALLRLKQRGILIVGFAPPFSEESAKALEADPKQQKIWKDFVPQLKQIFKELNLPFFDASRPRLLGLDDRYMTDGFHGEEMLHLHLLKRMLKDPQVRRNFPDTQRVIDKALASPQSNYWYPDYGTETLR